MHRVESCKQQMAKKSSTAAPHLNSYRDAAYDMVVLEAKSLYLYTIPTFCTITLKLKHMYMRTEDETGVNFYDVFHYFPGCSSLDVAHPRVTCVINGCIVKV